jgi:transposase-like protein
VDALVPITDNQRQRIIDLHAEGLARNEIARQVGCSAGTVTNVCRANDLDFDRSLTKKATEGKQIDAKALRASLAGDALTVAKEAQEALRRILAESSDLNLRDLATVYGIFMDKHIALAKHDAGNDTTATDSVVDQLLEGFKRQAGQ